MGLPVTRGNKAKGLESINKDIRTCFFTLAMEREALDPPPQNSKKDKSQTLMTKGMRSKKELREFIIKSHISLSFLLSS